MSFTRLCTVDNSFEANFLKDDLAGEGIECILTNENFTTLMPHVNGLLGAGIQIMVDENDLANAKRILLARTYDKEVLNCPNCGSTNLKYGLGTKHRLRRIVSIAISTLTAMPFNNIKNIYHCNDCKEEFQK